MMITLQPINEFNYPDALRVQRRPGQEAYVADSAEILARAYAYRAHRATAWGIYEDQRIVGLALLENLEDEPACYHLSELMIHGPEQGKGYGSQALALLLDHCRRERTYPTVEVCVKQADAAAIHVYEKAGFRNTGFTDPDAPDSLILSFALPEVRQTNLEFRLTAQADLPNVQRLWAEPAVMSFVGFPEGLQESLDNLEHQWLPWVQQPPKRQHWSVYDGDEYCGETFYDVDETGLASMDIKLLPAARGRGIAFAALSYALDAAFRVGGAKRAYVDPNPENGKALALYARLGFLPAARPAHLEEPDVPYVYLELTAGNWEARNGIS